MVNCDNYYYFCGRALMYLFSLPFHHKLVDGRNSTMDCYCRPCGGCVSIVYAGMVFEFLVAFLLFECAILCIPAMSS